jgi:acyl-CoA thioesterase
VTRQPGLGRTGNEFALKMLADCKVSAALGMRLLMCEPGSATVAMTVTEHMVNGAITHGGCVFALADTAFALACNGYGRFTVTAGATITFVAPSSVGDVLIAEAVERVRRGRSGVYDVTVRRGDDIVAEFRGTSREVGSSPAAGG